MTWDPRTAARRVTVGSLAALATATAFGLLAPHVATAAGPAVLVIAGLLALPHGAVDHLAIGWSRGGNGRPRPAFLLAYAVAALSVALLALAAPAPAVLVLLVLSMAHFAEGESAFDRLRGGVGRTLPAAALGCCIVVGPLLLRPSQADPLLASLAPGLPELVMSVRAPLLLAAGLLAVAGLVDALRSRSSLVAAELALVLVATALAPSLLVFAVWFGGWHATRHIMRLADLQPEGDGTARGHALMRGAFGPSVVAVAGLTALVVVTGGISSGLLVTLLALTVPHAAVVAWIGRLPLPLPRRA